MCHSVINWVIREWWDSGDLAVGVSVLTRGTSRMKRADARSNMLWGSLADRYSVGDAVANWVSILLQKVFVRIMKCGSIYGPG